VAGRGASSRSISVAPSRRTGIAALAARFGYDQKPIKLDRLKIASPSCDDGKQRSFDRVNASGKLALHSSAASLNQLTALIRAVCAVV